jgi:hypothetical protein
MATYDKGDRVRVTATFKTAGTPTGTTATCSQRKPSGTNSAPSVITGSSTGIYYVDIDLDQIGTHTVKITSDDIVIATETIEFLVTKSIFDHS